MRYRVTAAASAGPTRRYSWARRGTARRTPSDAEFEWALRTRDCYAFKRGFCLLTTLDNGWHAKDPLDFSGGTFSIEYVIPQNVLNRAEWLFASD